MSAESTYDLAIVHGQRSSEVTPLTVTEAEAHQLFTTTQYGPKPEGLGVILGSIKPCPEVCIGSGVDCGGRKFHRLGANVVSRTFLFGDYDHSCREQFFAMVTGLRQRFLKFWWSETFSSTPQNFRGRIVLPLNAPMPIASPEQFRDVVYATLMAKCGLLEGADPAGSNVAQIAFLPRAAAGERPREAAFVPGEPLDWRRALGERLDAFERAGRATKVAQARIASRPRLVPAAVSLEVLEDVRSRLVRYAARSPPLKRRAIENLIAGLMPGALPGLREASEPARNQVWRDVLWAVAAIAPDEVSTEVLMQVLVWPAWDAEAKASALAGVECTDRKKLEDMFERARGPASARRAQDAAEREAFAGRWSESPAARRQLERVRAMVAQARGGK